MSRITILSLVDITIYNNHLQVRIIYCTLPLFFFSFFFPSLSSRNISHLLFLLSTPTLSRCGRPAEQFLKFNKIRVSYMGLNLTCNKAQTLQSIHPVSPVPVYVFSPLFLPSSSSKIPPMNHANAENSRHCTCSHPSKPHSALSVSVSTPETQ